MFENLVAFISRAYEDLDNLPTELRKISMTRCAGACDFVGSCDPSLDEAIIELWDNTWLPLFKEKVEK